MDGKNTYHDLLLLKFEQKKSSNPAYSLRAFARHLEISVSKLSQIFNRKQGLSMKSAEAIAAKLNLDHEEKTFFCNSAGALHSRSKKNRHFYQGKLNEKLKG